MATSHRSYQPTHPCGNKLLQKKWDQTYYDEHRRMVKTAKPMVDTKPPKRYAHITEKSKKRQQERERKDEIERDDHNLLDKMRHIMHTTGRVDHRNTYYNEHRGHSLNYEKRQRELERVARENEAMLQRIQKVEPQYHVSDWISDWQRKEELTEMITAYPSAPPPQLKKPVQVISESSPIEPETQDTSAPAKPTEAQEAPSPTPEAKKPPAPLKLSRTTPNLAHEISKASSRRKLSATAPNLIQEFKQPRQPSAPQRDRQSSANAAMQSSPRPQLSITVPNLEQLKQASLESKVKQKDVQRTFT